MAVLVATSGCPKNYQIIDTIFALDSSTAGMFKGVDSNKAFDGVKDILRKKCEQLGGDAVINCQFEYRIALDGKRQSLEFFAYGTAVKFVE